MTERVSPELQKAFVPTGTLRASINLGNPVLAGTDKATGRVKGVSVDLANALGEHLGVPVELVLFDTAIKSVTAVTEESADVGFFAIDPLRGASIAFTPPYVLIEGCYLVREASHFQSNDEIDAAGLRVAVGKGSAYDLYLSRELRHATIVHAPNSAAVVGMFIEQRLDVAAGVKQQLEADAKRLSGLRLLPGRFMMIQQAMGLPKLRGAEAAAFLSRFIEDMKAASFVAEALKRHQIEGASVAPPIALTK
jgi:polar amino acid transport system substrate-binding protein